MRVKVLFFGMLRDHAGLAADHFDLPEGAHLSDLAQACFARWPAIEALKKSIVLARNQEFSPLDTPLADGDEIALLPPVSGGAHEHHFALTRDPIDTRALIAQTQRPQDGAVVTFEGVVRDNTRGRATLFLEYECYESMALKLMESIGIDLAARHQIGRIAIVHRLGRLEIGEASVVIVVSAPHRKPAFDAAFEAINTLKKTVPIWKKEHFADGAVWVEGEWDESTPRASSPL